MHTVTFMYQSLKGISFLTFVLLILYRIWISLTDSDFPGGIFQYKNISTAEIPLNIILFPGHINEH